MPNIVSNTTPSESIDMPQKIQPEQNKATNQFFNTIALLRGVCSVMIMLYHFAEFNPFAKKYFFSHSYLAVDFFFLVSGFFVSYTNRRTKDYNFIVKTQSILKSIIYTFWQKINQLFRFKNLANSFKNENMEIVINDTVDLSSSENSKNSSQVNSEENGNKINDKTDQNDIQTVNENVTDNTTLKIENKMLFENNCKNEKIEKCQTQKPNVFNPFKFLLRRAVRLFPMQLFSTIMAFTSYTSFYSLSFGNFVLCFLLNTFAIPNWNYRYTFNPNLVMWTIFYEYVYALIYAFFLKYIHIVLMIFVDVVFCLLLVLSQLHVLKFSFWQETMSFNMGYSLYDSGLFVGFTRAGFSYVNGIVFEFLISKLQIWWMKKYNKKLEIPFGAFICVLIVVISFVINVQNINGMLDNVYCLMCVCVVYPLVLIVATNHEIQNPVIKKLAIFGGNVSYPLFALHYTFMQYLAERNIVNINNTELVKWVLYLQMSFVVFVFSCAVQIYYDEPIRIYISRKLFQKK
ncbi:hypothetical protein EIN_270210 [Entamoeba invadens IP1]|uniref:Acyltransferase 3 domain-containing protein n=1 Tax=Entamoeba invadens IP1 TaxID=370355 RepID=A0A0A1UEA2_ENTIV|nr:hypothetical protein EIN_270210 [Entamoeba invadens IP1]ELP91135.1 hypothetical protein EIN_270210 [Entamoeba invadens IP1]|eukprot:XP_004257906.1 hypothetical protein EIN_270210 [Entamoeba invadens IP1]